MADPSIVMLAVVLIAALVLLLLGLVRLLHRRGKTAHERWQQWRGCTRKRAYSTNQEAQIIVARHA